MLDDELVARAQDGDVDAFASLVERYQPLAVGLAAVVLRDPAEADDVAQEAFVKAYYALNRFKPGGSFKAWLVQIVVNEARNARGAAQRRTNVHARFREEVSRRSASASAEESAVAVEERNSLLLALDALREDDRSILIFRYVFDLSEAEMAEALACSPGTVKSRLSRALARLRSDLSRVAPLLAVSPALGLLLGRTLTPAATPMGGASARALADAVLGHIASGTAAGAASSASSGGTRPTPRQFATIAAAATGVVGMVLAGLLLSTVGGRSIPVSPAPSPSVPPPTVYVVYGGDLTDAQRQELGAALGIGPQVPIDTVDRAELVATLQAAGLAVDGSERAISSAVVTCLPEGNGLRVRTENVTQIPAAAYANALVTAGIVDADVVVAAPPSTPMTGETALVGVLKAYPRCDGGDASSPERLRLAYDELHVTADIAQSSGSWDKAAALMLRGSQTAIGAPSPDQLDADTSVDAAATAEGITLTAQQRTDVLSVLNQLATLDQGVYAGGYVIQDVSANEARVVPNPESHTS
jgi:RNA polymerase sigma factor (sigma-70 family)